ncbi:MAG: MFS transporter [Prevotellaceae bacterium]|jgi:MFS family permease|nr:MFS transporter [Prevotellaceae bacterium]
MTVKTQTLLRDSAAMRWMMLLLVALTMFAVYVASDVFSPLKTLLEQQNQWNSTEYGWFSGSYSLFNVFLGMLIFGGLLLDKAGIRFTGIISCALMVVGIGIKYWAVSNPDLLNSSMTFLGNTYKMQVVWAVVGFATFGVGAEVAGITVSKAIVKWFKGKELALAMGLQLSLARLGSAAALSFSPIIAKNFHSVSAPVMVGLILLVAGGLCFIIYSWYDKRLDKQIKEEATVKEESFSLKDVGAVISNKGFWGIALLCLMFYAAVFPFLKYAADLMVNKFGVDPSLAGFIPSMLPVGAIILTPLFGTIYDRRGHGADLMILGAVIITCVHLLFAASFVTHWLIAVVLMIFLGIGFAMVPAAMWPSLAKIIPEKRYGTAIALTFFIQNIGLLFMPTIIGTVLDKYCITGTRIDITTKVVDGQVLSVLQDVSTYDYRRPMLIFVSVCVVAVLIAIFLKYLNKKMGYGLQEANRQKA